MPTEKKRRLEKTVAALQGRWGIRAVRRLGADTAAAIPHISTSFSFLDDALRIGGIPRGRMSEIIGIPTSGMATLALKIAAQAQHDGTAVYLDWERTFDPHYATRCGIDLSHLVLARPYNDRQGLALVQDFVTGGGCSALIVDLPFRLLVTPAPAEALSTMLSRLIVPLARTECALIFLTSLPPKSAPSLVNYPRRITLPHYAAVRLLLQREHWLYRRRDILGYQAQVLVVKNKLGPSGQSIHLAITFNGVVAADNE